MMVPPTPAAEDPASDAPQTGGTGSLLDILASLWRAALQGVQARADLVALDVRRAGLSFAQMLMLVGLCVFLLWTSWAALMVGAVLALAQVGWSMGWGIALVVVANLLITRLLWHRIAALALYLTLPDVRAHLMSKDHG